MTDMLKHAIEYAERGWYVFPCREKPGTPFFQNEVKVTPMEKQPYVSGGLNSATLDVDQITAWWNTWPNAMIGVNAGKSGLFVVDIDKKHVNGLDTYMEWQVNDADAFHTMTPSGGMHIIFSGNGKTSTNAETGIDTRGEGGYFIAPPSVILKGSHSGEYKRFGENWAGEPGVIPDVLVEMFSPTSYEYSKDTSTSPYGRSTLSRETLEFVIDGAMEGERNTKLFKALADMAGCGYTTEEARERLLPVSKRIGLPDGEFETVLQHAYSKERSPSIPADIQKRIQESNDKRNLATTITQEEQVVLEDVLLAGLILNNDMISMVGDILDAEDFQVIRNRIIYKSIQRLHYKNLKVDYITLATEVAKETADISMDEISKIVKKYEVIAENIVTYANIIKEKSAIKKIESMMDNKGKYMSAGNLTQIISRLEHDLSGIAVSSGANSSSILDAKQSAEMVRQRTIKIATGQIQLLKLGLSKFDNILGGLFPTDLVMIAGRPGSGKSALCLSLANNLAIKSNKKVGYFILEMSIHETISRLITQLTGIPYKDVFMGRIKKTESDSYNRAFERISNSSIFFDDTPMITIPQLRTKIRTLVEKDNIDIVIIDQLEQIIAPDTSQKTHIQYDKIGYALKAISKEFEVPIILAHQLNRSVTDRRHKNAEPQLSDLNQAGEKPTDQVWAIHHLINEDTGEIEMSKIKLLKNRNGAVIDFGVAFVGERMLFTDLAREEDTRSHWDGHTQSNSDVIPF